VTKKLTLLLRESSPAIQHISTLLNKMSEIITDVQYVHEMLVLHKAIVAF